MKLIIALTAILFSIAGNMVNGQPYLRYPFYLKIYTDTGNFRIGMSDLLDSSIEYTKSIKGHRGTIPVNVIRYIKVKRPILTTAFVDCATGILIGLALDVFVILVHAQNTLDGEFFQNSLKVIIGGGCAGFIGGLAISTFFKVKIPINKNQQLFQKNRNRLFKYLIF